MLVPAKIVFFLQLMLIFNSNILVANVLRDFILSGAGILSRRSASPCGYNEHSFCMSKDRANVEKLLLDDDEVRNFDQLFSCESQSGKNRLHRNAERFKTQPITREEIVSSQRYVNDCIET